jgi:putative FmdB family regulatory protein
MPLYDYTCETCGPFRTWRSMSQYGEPAECPTCAEAAPRMMATPNLNDMLSTSRIAHSRNEKSAHNPDVVKVFPSGHAHDHKHTTDGHHHVPQHRHRSKRPWMVGH